ncbi:unnamed protein product [Albugo candida]|uniref:Uncharacterized protein n=1 Tax=Albugo candida TaxID=65357 RepID=A0A024G2P3_9STRA|nr:unnamed protein product [Albugo candida]|eukprot:CCI41040.1 unnamed protein product [Albugo candida]
MASEKIDADGLLTFTGARPYSSKSIGEIEYANAKTDDTDKNGTLLEYYRQRCTQFHHERETFMQHIARIEISKEQSHRLKWTLRARDKEIERLEKSLTSLEQDLYKQKSHIQVIQTENEILRSQEKVDRDKIERLLTISEPILDESPKTVDDAAMIPQIYAYPSTMYIGSVAARTKTTNQKRKAISDKSTNQTISDVHRKSIADTKTQSQDSLKIENLTQELALAQKKMNIVKEDYAMREKNAEERIQMLTAQLSMIRNKQTQKCDEAIQRNRQLEKELDKTNRILHQTTAEYLVLRHNSQENERLVLEELSSLQERYRLLEHQENELSSLTSRKESIHDRDKEKIQQKQLQTREREISGLKDQIGSMQDTYRQRTEDLQARLRSLRNRYRSLETRRRMEMEGFGRDVATLRRHLHKLEVLFYEQHLESRDTKTLQIAETVNANELNEAIRNLRQKFADLATDLVNETNSSM